MADMRVVHEGDETLDEGETERRVIATEVERADTTLSQAKGLMFRSSLPDEYALVLEVGEGGFLSRGPSRHVVHMLFVRVPLDVVWLVDDEVIKTARMHPWRSIAMGRANRILELPAGAAEGVQPGDTLRIERADESLDESLDE